MDNFDMLNRFSHAELAGRAARVHGRDRGPRPGMPLYLLRLLCALCALARKAFTRIPFTPFRLYEKAFWREIFSPGRMGSCQIPPSSLDVFSDELNVPFAWTGR